MSEPHLVLKNLTRICLLADLTLMLAWNSDEAGKIIETYKIYQNKPPDKIMERIENDPHQKVWFFLLILMILIKIYICFISVDR